MNKSIQGRKSKIKGKIGELEHAKWLTKITGVDWGRTPSSGAFHQDFPFDAYKRSAKETIMDKVGNENKNTKSLMVKNWIKQIEEACEDCFGMVNWKYWYIRFSHNRKRYFIIPESYFEYLLKIENDKFNKES